MGLNNIIKAKFLVEGQSLKNWLFIIYVVFWTLVLIANNHFYEEKMMRIKALTEQVKELRSEFVDKRSELMQLRMESNVSRQMEPLGVLPSSVPPKKIKVVVEKEKKWYELWE
ncbi:MAG TPA: FtsL-like putative cell division protein [Flavobacterium sp.]|nr:FtsL-like putative cell division protein [Flavobacterium sp.]